MMTSPKAQFQQNTERRARWAEVVSHYETQQAVTHALAQMALTPGMTQEMLFGANRFISELLFLSSEKPPMRDLPVRQLKSYDPVLPQTAKK